MDDIFTFFAVSYQVLAFNKWYLNILLFVMPVITTLLGIERNRLYFESGDKSNFLLFICLMCDFLNIIIQPMVLWFKPRMLYNDILCKMKESHTYCGCQLPDEKKYEDLMRDTEKVRDFVFLFPIIWITVTGLGINIIRMDIDNGNNLFDPRWIIFISCLFCLIIMTYYTDETLYCSTKPSVKKIRNIDDKELSCIKLALGGDFDLEYENTKKMKQYYQQCCQKVIICFLNFIITYVSLSTYSVNSIINFTSVTMMVGILSDNIKSYKYYKFMEEFLDLYNLMTMNKYHSYDVITKTPKIDELRLVDINYGYKKCLSQPVPNDNIKIRNMSYTFTTGNIYCLMSPNGTGKSSLLKALTYNLVGGDIFFGEISRKRFSFEMLHRSIFHLKQASEYCAHFSHIEVKEIGNPFPELALKLQLGELFEKSFSEMSGGEKQRILIYYALISPAPIVLLDETFSEISCGSDGSQGLRQIILDAIIEFNKRNPKIIIIVGHGVFESIKIKKQDVHLLTLRNTREKTYFEHFKND